MIGQPRRVSFFEATTQAIIGLPIGFTVSFAVVSLGLSAVMTATLTTGLMFTITVVRGYVIRRGFERNYR